MSSGGAYSPGITSGSGGSSSCSGGCFNSDGVKYQYLQGYMNAHLLPIPSYRYVYIMWFGTVVVSLVLGASHMLGIGDRSYMGAKWKQLATKNRTLKLGKRVDIYGNHIAKDPYGSSLNDAPPRPRRIFSFPSFGRLALLFCMIAIPTVLTFVGADFIGPNVSVFDFSQSWPARPDSYVGLSRRALHTLHKRFQWGQGSYPHVTTYPPTRTLPYRTWWTTGVRTGDITMAMVPIVIFMAMKQVPFALFSTRFFGGYAFDRLSFLHKWGGRLIWLFATTHLVTWTIQLNIDIRPGAGDVVWSFVFMWIRFRWGWASYGFLTAMNILSIGPIRSRFYEWFYIGHIITVIGFLVCAMLHHPPLAIWMYVPLAWWFAERLSRALKVAWVNGVGFAGRKPQFALAPKGIHMSGPHRPSAPHSQLAVHDQYVAESLQNGNTSSALSSYRFPVQSGKDSDYEPTLVDSMAHKRYSKQSDPSNNDHVGTPPEDEYPLASQHPLAAKTPLSASERRATRLSSRYDMVDELIQEYVPTKTPDAASFAQPSVFVPHLPRQYTSNGVPKYNLEDPVEAREPSHQHASTTLPEYPPPRIARDANNFSAVTPRPYTAFSTMSASMPRSLRPRPAMSADVAALIRPGFAFVQLLPGKTLRLTLRTPNKMSWKPGQWVYLLVPGVRMFQSHPFTIASAHDADFPVSTQFQDVDEEKGYANIDKAKGEERTIVLLIRCRKGFTKDLWDHVAKRRVQQIEAAADAQHAASRLGMPGAPAEPMLGKDTTGVHLRSIIDGPFGSADRTHWNIHSSIVIICGGSGVSFGISVLEHLCACMSGAAALGKKGKGGRKFLTERVRFVWILREFAHLQWIASALRRCIEMVTPEQLQVELFVTHFNHTSALPANEIPQYDKEGSRLPTGHSGTDPRDQGRWKGTLDQSYSQDTPIQAARFTEGPEQEEYEITANDLTHFEGEDESAPTAAEEEINKRIRSEGKLRRANTRRRTNIKQGGRSVKPANIDGNHEQMTLQSQQIVHDDRATTPHPLSNAASRVPTNEDSFPQYEQGYYMRGEQDLGERSFDLPSGYRRPSMDFQNAFTFQRGYSNPKLPSGLASTQDSYADPRSDANAPSGYRRPSVEFQLPYPNTRSDSNARMPTSYSAGLAVPQSSSGPFGGSLGAYVSPDTSRPGTRRGSELSNYGFAPSGTSSAYPSVPYGIDRQAMGSSQTNLPEGGLSTPLPHSSTLNLLTAVAAPGSDAKSPVDDSPIDLNVEEDQDLRVIAELAKPGHPKLDRIIRQEVENSHGRTLVAGCGPRSLDTVLRSIVSKQIDPTKVRKGDTRGIVNIVSECFEWGG